MKDIDISLRFYARFWAVLHILKLIYSYTDKVRGSIYAYIVRYVHYKYYKRVISIINNQSCYHHINHIIINYQS